MKQPIWSLLLVFALCPTAAAQKTEGAKNDATDKATAQPSAPTPLLNLPVFDLKPNQTGSNAEKPGHQNQLARMKYVVKDGAVYLDVLGNGTFAPMPGGGASGCFSRDLPERRERLRIYIESLPQEKPPSIRQTETYAM